MSLNRQLFIPLLHYYNGLRHTENGVTLYFAWIDHVGIIYSYKVYTFLWCLGASKCVTHWFVFTWYSVLILPKPRRLLSTHTTVKLFTLSLPHVNTAHENQRFACVHFEAKQNQTNIKKLTFSFFFLFSNNSPSELLIFCIV